MRRFEALTAKTDVAAVVSFYERDGSSLYNSVAFVEGGEVKGVYRKTHIPDDHYYQEKFYFAPGNTGFVTFAASFGRVGVGICWDQWFPETARCLALAGAEIILYPTAIGLRASTRHRQRGALAPRHAGAFGGQLHARRCG